MDNAIINVNFDRKKVPDIDFEILSLESILQRTGLAHDPRSPHKVNFYLLILITSGTGKHSIDFEEYELRPGSVLTIRKDQIQCFHDGSHHGRLLLFTEEYLLSYLDTIGTDKIAELFNELLFSQHTLLNASQFEEALTIVQQIDQEFNQPLDEHSPGIIRNLLQVLTSKIHRVRSQNLSLVPEHKYTHQLLALQKLVETDGQKSRSVQYYAEQLNVTTKTLNNITQRMLSKSAKQFIDDLITLKIKRLLINTNDSIKEIAYQTGFEEPSNLFKYFKRQTLQTPEVFRQAHTYRS
ncbi:MAG: AraC family transcriptional regulator [Roseivirga sp.]